MLVRYTWEGGISYQLPIVSFFRETDQMTSNMLLITAPSTMNRISVNRLNDNSLPPSRHNSADLVALQASRSDDE